MRVRFDTRQINRLHDDIEAAADTIIPRTQNVIMKTGYDTVTAAQVRCPVRSGHLKSTIGVDIDMDGLGFEVGATAEYAGYVEFGTTKMAPQPYLMPAFNQRVGIANRAFGALVDPLRRRR
jgi:HK97 gp10 family phage protein